MEILTGIVIALVLIAYVGYKNYTSTSTSTTTTEPALDLVNEVVEEKQQPVIEEIKPEVKKAAPKTKKTTKAVPDVVVEEVKEPKVKTTKKKPNMKVVK